MRESDLVAWNAAAGSEGKTLSSWLEDVANGFVRRRPPMLIEEVETRLIGEALGYAVTRDGRVFSRHEDGWKVCRVHPDGDGYLGLTIACSDGVKRRKKVHRLVIEAFRGPPTEGQVCRHLDGDRTNNDINNLVWGTRSENAQDAVKHRKMRQAGEIPPLPETSSKIFGLRMRPEEREAIARAAASAGMSSGEWSRTVLNAVAGVAPLPSELKIKVVGVEEEGAEDEVRDGEW